MTHQPQNNRYESAASPPSITEVGAAEVAHSDESADVKKRLTSWIVAAGSALMIAAAGYWLYDRLVHVNVSDAHVSATMVTLSARVPGWVSGLHVEESETVVVGTLLAGIDDRDAKLALEGVQAELASMRSEKNRVLAERDLTEGQIEANVHRAQSQLAAANSAHRATISVLDRARSERNRAIPLRSNKVISQELWEQKESSFEQAKQNSLVAEAEVLVAQAQVEEARIAKKTLDVYDQRIQRMTHEYRQAVTRGDRLAVSLEDHRIISPINGAIDQIFIDPGEYVIRGQRMLVIHDTNDVWVTANIKETDIRHVAVGAIARITVDAYPDREFEGVVRRIGIATTSEFALLPNPNPSGNFTKITQRLEVRIDLPQDNQLLKPGMMVEVEIAI